LFCNAVKTRHAYLPGTYKTVDEFKAGLLSRYTQYVDIFSDRIVEKLYEWDKKCDHSEMWDPPFNPLQENFGNSLKLSIVLQHDWAKEFLRVIIHNVDDGYLLRPAPKHDYVETIYKTEEQLWEVICSIEKKLHLKKLKRSI